MYYYFPENDMAYKTDAKGSFSQYFFGDDMIVAPIVTRADSNTQMAKVFSLSCKIQQTNLY